MIGGMVKNQQGLHGARRLIVVQLSITLLLCLIAVMFSSMEAAKSVLLGGLVCIIPNAYFAKKLFQHQGAQATKKIISNFYQGEALKIILSVALFALVFKFMRIMPLLFFVSYMLVQWVIWFAPLIIGKYRPKSD